MSDTQEIADLRAEVERLRGALEKATKTLRRIRAGQAMYYGSEAGNALSEIEKALTAAPVATDEPAQEGGAK